MVIPKRWLDQCPKTVRFLNPGAWPLHISRDPLLQGFAVHGFDLIVPSGVLHATPLVATTMAHVRKLLKPMGQLVLMESTAVTAAQHAIFDTLEGWWMAQDGRQDGPLLAVPEWDTVLRRAGFSGASIAIPSHTGISKDASTLTLAHTTEIVEATTKNDSDGRDSLESHTASGSGPKHIAWVYPGHLWELNAAFEGALSVSLSRKGIACGRGKWPSANRTNNVPDTTADGLRIDIDTAEHPILLNQNQDMFEKIKNLVVCGSDQHPRLATNG